MNDTEPTPAEEWFREQMESAFNTETVAEALARQFADLSPDHPTTHDR